MSTQSSAVESAPAIASIPFWIDGRAAVAHTTRRGDVTNPSTGQVIRSVPLANAQDVDEAVKSARAAFPEWRAPTTVRSARVLVPFRVQLDANPKELASLIRE